MAVVWSSKSGKTRSSPGRELTADTTRNGDPVLMEMLEHDWVRKRVPDSGGNFSTYVPPGLAWDGVCLGKTPFFLSRPSVTELSPLSQAGFNLIMSPRLASN